MMYKVPVHRKIISRTGNSIDTYIKGSPNPPKISLFSCCLDPQNLFSSLPVLQISKWIIGAFLGYFPASPCAQRKTKKQVVKTFFSIGRLAPESPYRMATLHLAKPGPSSNSLTQDQSSQQDIKELIVTSHDQKGHDYLKALFNFNEKDRNQILMFNGNYFRLPRP